MSFDAPRPRPDALFAVKGGQLARRQGHPHRLVTVGSDTAHPVTHRLGHADTRARTAFVSVGSPTYHEKDAGFVMPSQKRGFKTVTVGGPAVEASSGNEARTVDFPVTLDVTSEQDSAFTLYDGNGPRNGRRRTPGARLGRPGRPATPHRHADGGDDGPGSPDGPAESAAEGDPHQRLAHALAARYLKENAEDGKSGFGAQLDSEVTRGLMERSFQRIFAEALLQPEDTPVSLQIDPGTFVEEMITRESLADIDRGLRERGSSSLGFIEQSESVQTEIVSELRGLWTAMITPSVAAGSIDKNINELLRIRPFAQRIAKQQRDRGKQVTEADIFAPENDKLYAKAFRLSWGNKVSNYIDAQMREAELIPTSAADTIIHMRITRYIAQQRKSGMSADLVSDEELTEMFWASQQAAGPDRHTQADAMVRGVITEVQSSIRKQTLARATRLFGTTQVESLDTERKKWLTAADGAPDKPPERRGSAEAESTERSLLYVTAADAEKSKEEIEANPRDAYNDEMQLFMDNNGLLAGELAEMVDYYVQESAFAESLEVLSIYEGIVLAHRLLRKGRTLPVISQNGINTLKASADENARLMTQERIESMVDDIDAYAEEWLEQIEDVNPHFVAALRDVGRYRAARSSVIIGAMLIYWPLVSAAEAENLKKQIGDIGLGEGTEE